MHNNSSIELSRSALMNNIAYLRSVLGSNVILSSVVKGNAYGHGVKEFVGLASSCGITHFSAFDAEEAKIIKSTLGDNATVMIMGFIADDDIAWAITNQVEFYVFNLLRLQSAAKIARQLGIAARVHVEAETGMNRTGFDAQDLIAVVEILKNQAEHIIFAGFCTHYAGAESTSNFERVSKQIENYNEQFAYLCQQSIQPLLRHTACSAAAMVFPETRMDLVRIGIMQYGLWPSPEVQQKFVNSDALEIDPLRRLISWKSEVMSVKKISAGEYVGYGTSFKAERAITIAIVPIGYSHGYSRSLSNHGHVLINGKQCHVVGTVSMNMMSVNVTDTGTVSPGDEVVLIGTQRDATITISSFSDLSNQLNYELLTRIAKTIPRKIAN